MSINEYANRPVPCYEGYFVDRLGRIYGPRGLLRPMQARSGHLYIIVKRCRPRKLFVHRAVLAAFVGPCPDGCECCHNDGNPANNELSNLRWDTTKANAEDKRRHGSLPACERSGTAKLTSAQVRHIREVHGTRSLRALAKEFGVSHTAVRRAALGIKWASLETNA